MSLAFWVNLYIANFELRLLIFTSYLCPANIPVFGRYGRKTINRTLTSTCTNLFCFLFFLGGKGYVTSMVRIRYYIQQQKCSSPYFNWAFWEYMYDGGGGGQFDHPSELSCRHSDQPGMLHTHRHICKDYHYEILFRKKLYFKNVLLKLY